MRTVRIIPAGARFGRLTVVETRDQGGERIRCRCECGAETSVSIEMIDRTKSCGCLKRDRCIERSTRHGMAGTPEYEAWCQMKARCLNPDHPRFGDYGGRGITVCDRWLDFANFASDMGRRPEGMSLDRIDNDQGYCPENCRWATRSVQSINRRRHGFESRTRNELGQFT